MNKFEAVLFDLDGTLLDSLGDIADSMNSVLASHDLPIHDTLDYRDFVGAGIEDLVARALPPALREGKSLDGFIEEMKAAYADRWDATTRPYPGVGEMLDRLVERGMPIAVVSNKPEDFVHLAIARLLSSWSFAAVFGVVDERPPKPHPAAALEAARSLGVEPAVCAFVGDSGSDMITATAAGMVPVGVLWGFRTREELLENGAERLVSTPAELSLLLTAGA